MNWSIRKREPNELPARKTETPHGTINIPSKRVTSRHWHVARSDAANWDQAEADLLEFWVKACETIPQYHEDPRTATWNNLVCELDAGNGNLSTWLWHDNTQPSQDDPITVSIHFDFWQREAGVNARRLKKRVEEALVNSARRDPAKSALKALHAIRDFRVTTVHHDTGDRSKPLFTIDW